MGNYDKTFKTICRVCLQHDKNENMVSLCDTSGESALSFYGVSFENLTKISVKQNDYFPTKICKQCTKTLEELIVFMSRCKTSDKKLSKLIAFSLKQDLNGELVKEVICQYTLFCQYFPEESVISNYASTSHFEENMKSLTEENFQKSENGHSEYIKIEAPEIPIHESDSDEDIYQNVPTNQENVSQSDSDNVDMFLDSIEKLVSSKIKQDTRKRKFKKEIVVGRKEQDKERNLTCNICFKTLANSATYDNHMQRHEGCRYICDQCGKGFPVLYELTQHQLYQHGIGLYLECDYCSFKAGKRLELIEHIRLHTGERPFTCEKCGLNFRRKAIYHNHLKCHNEKSVPCNYCPRKFYRRSEMLAHCNNIHDRMYLYLCRICNVTYAKAQTVRKHMVIKHGIPREMQGKIIRVNKNANSMLFKDSKMGEGDFHL